MHHTEPVGSETAPARSTDDATRIFTTSVVVSGVRCLLAYVVFPWVLPLLGIARGVGPVIGIVIGVVAIGFNVASIRRFHGSGHPWRWMITSINVTAILALTILVAIDISDVLS